MSRFQFKDKVNQELKVKESNTLLEFLLLNKVQKVKLLFNRYSEEK